MTNAELSKYVKHYVERDKTKSAIMLTAEWGTGKSHYITNELVPFLENNGGHKCIVVSLYGLSSVNDISKSIYLEARAKVFNSTSEGVTAGKLAAKTVLKGVSSFFGIELGASEEEMQKLYQSIDLSGKLIILEDIERTQIDLLELMGYVNSLVEQDGVKVLLVANEKEILQYEPEEEVPQKENDLLDGFNKRPEKKEWVYTAATKAYLKTKEKTISDTIVYYGNFQEAIQQIICSFGDVKLNRFAVGDHAKEIYGIMETLKNYNLRSFIFACQKTVDIYQSLEGDYNEDFLTCIFFGIINYSMRVKTGEKMNWSGTENFSLELGSEKYPLFRFCFDYINFQMLNRTKIPVADKALQNLRLYDKRKTQNDPEINIVCNYHRYSERDLRAAVESIQKRLADPTDISFYDYGVLAVYLLRVKHCYGLDVTEGQRLLVENLRGRGAEIDAEALFRVTVRGAEEQLQKEFDTLRKAMTDALKGEEAILGFGYLPEQVHLFSEQFQGNRECYETGKLAANFDIPRLIEMFFACTPAQMDEVRYAFVRSYRSSNIGEFLSGDKDALTQLRDGVIAGVNNHNLDCVQKLQSEWFAENLNEIIRKLC